MAGPFQNYAPPNVYVSTLTEPAAPGGNVNVRIPCFIGVGDEFFQKDDVEMIRGSSSTADNYQSREDVSDQLDGTNRKFVVKKYPIVTGEGVGQTTLRPTDVTVEVNGERVGVSVVRGATGEVFLDSIPFDEDIVKVSYYYKKTDTLVTDEDESYQLVQDTVTELYVDQGNGTSSEFYLPDAGVDFDSGATIPVQMFYNTGINSGYALPISDTLWTSDVGAGPDNRDGVIFEKINATVDFETDLVNTIVPGPISTQVVQPLVSNTLAVATSGGETTITLTSAADFSTSGFILIYDGANSEELKYTSKSGNVLTLSGTVANAHSSLVKIELVPLGVPAKITATLAADFTSGTTVSVDLGDGTAFGKLVASSILIDGEIGTISSATASTVVLGGALTNDKLTDTIAMLVLASTETDMFMVNSTSNFPSAGYIKVGSEIIEYTGTTAHSFIGLTRGSFSTTAINHFSGESVQELSFEKFHLGKSGVDSETLEVTEYSTLLTTAQFDFEPGAYRIAAELTTTEALDLDVANVWNPWDDPAFAGIVNGDLISVAVNQSTINGSYYTFLITSTHAPATLYELLTSMLSVASFNSQVEVFTKYPIKIPVYGITSSDESLFGYNFKFKSRSSGSISSFYFAPAPFSTNNIVGNLFGVSGSMNPNIGQGIFNVGKVVDQIKLNTAYDPVALDNSFTASFDHVFPENGTVLLSTYNFLSSGATFYVSHKPIVDGTNGGVTTTSTEDVTAKVNGVIVPVASVDGLNGKVVLSTIPPKDAEIKITYYFNAYQNTFDELPNDQVFEILKVGDVPNRADYIETVDFVLSDNKIYWGAAYDLNPTIHTPGAEYFDSSQITTTLVDNKVYMRPCAGVTDGTNKTFTLEFAPTEGTGTDIITNDPTKVLVYVAEPEIDPGIGAYKDTAPIAVLTSSVPEFDYWDGFSVVSSDGGADFSHSKQLDSANDGFDLGTGTDQIPLAVVSPVARAISNPTSYTIISLDGENRKFTLNTAPKSGAKVFATYWTNMLGDDDFDIEIANIGSAKETPGAISIGTYTINSREDGPISVVKEVSFAEGGHNVQDASFAIEGIVWPNSFPDVQGISGQSPTEVIRCTFVDTGERDEDSLPISRVFRVTSSRSSTDLADGLGQTGGVETPVGAPVNDQDVGAFGYLNQTFIDTDTGIRFTVGDPQLTGANAISDSLSQPYYFRPGDTLVFSSDRGGEFQCSVVPNIQIPGLRVVINNTTDTAVGDTTRLRTFDKAGNEPSVGSFYYTSYRYVKPDEFFEPRLFISQSNITREYGPISTTRKISLATFLAFVNGASILAVKQIKKATDEEDAPSETYIEAIKSMSKPLDGDIPVALVQPITTDETVLEYLRFHNIEQSSKRYANERISYIGFPLGTKPSAAQVKARAYNSERIIAVYPDGAVVGLVDELNREVEFAVGGEFLAAAMTGLDVSPAYDVAEPMTKKQITGFKRLARKLDAVEANITANAGICLLKDKNPVIEVVHGLTTNMGSVLTREISIIKIADYVQQALRNGLQQFIGMKFLNQRLGEVVNVMGAILRGLVELKIISNFTGINAVRDSNDPTMMNCEAYYQPIFGLNYINVTLNLRVSL